MPEIKPLKLYWESHLVNGQKNFGDWLSPVLCAHLSGREVIHEKKANQADLVAIGSILHRVKHQFWRRRTHIWGSGFMYDREPVKGYHRYHAVRGKKTAALITGTNIDALGDPGLLVDLLFPQHASIPKRHKLGIIPHHIDRFHPEFLAMRAAYPDIHVLDVLSDTHQFLADVASCETIISSSLHGLVTADSFGIPNAWVRISDAVLGDGFKFHDYYSIFNMIPKPMTLSELTQDSDKLIQDTYQRPGLEQIKKDLVLSFPRHLIAGN